MTNHTVYIAELGDEIESLPCITKTDKFALLDDDQLDIWTLCVDNIQYYSYQHLVARYESGLTYPFGLSNAKNNDEKLGALFNILYYDPNEPSKHPALLSHEQMMDMIKEIGESFIVGAVMSGMVENFLPYGVVNHTKTPHTDDEHSLPVNNIRIFCEVMLNYIRFKHTSGLVIRMMGVGHIIKHLFNYYTIEEKNDAVDCILNAIGGRQTVDVCENAINLKHSPTTQYRCLSKHVSDKLIQMYSEECKSLNDDQRIFLYQKDFVDWDILTDPSPLLQIYNERYMDDISEVLDVIDLSDYRHTDLQKLLTKFRGSSRSLSPKDRFKLIMTVAPHIGENPDEYF